MRISSLNLSFVTKNPFLKWLKSNIVILFFPFYSLLFECVNGSQMIDAKTALHLFAHMGVTLFLLLFVNWLFCLLPHLGRCLSAVFQSILLIPLWLTVYVLYSGIPFNQDTVIAIYQTTPLEAWNYLTTFPSALFGLFLNISSVVALGIFCTERLYLKRRWLYLPAIGFLAIYPSLRLTISDFRGGYYGISRLMRMYIDYDSANKRFESISKSFGDLDSLRGYVGRGNDARGAILIGESHSRVYMTPQNSPFYFSVLEATASKDNLFCFDRTYACFVHTITSLSMVMTNKNQYSGVHMDRTTVFEGAIPLQSLLKARGYYQRWIANQEINSSFSTPLADS